MTEQKAIERIRYRIDTASEIVGNGEEGNAFEDMEVAIKALEKQIPTKPTLEGDGYADGHLIYDTWICPNCGKDYEVDYEEYDYCPNCGQHIDWKNIWEDENE